MTKRQPNIELLRLLAMLGIIMMHMMNHGMVIMFTHPGQASYYECWSLFAPGMNSINILILISGYFLVGRPFSVKRLAKLESQVLFYTILITLGFKLLTDVNIDFETWLYSFLPVTSDFYWYVTMYFGMYLFSPVLNKLISALSKSQLKMTCILGLVLLGAWTNIIFYSSGLNVAGGVSIAWFLLMYLCGAYIKLYYEPDGRWKKKALVSFGLTALLPLSRFLFEFLQTTPLEKIGLFEDLLWGFSVFYQYNSIIVIISSILIFITFLNINIKGETAGKIINTAASASFGVYLIHEHSLMRMLVWEELIKPYNWIDHPYLVPAALGAMLALYAVCMVIELSRQALFKIWESDAGYNTFFDRLDDKLRSMWNGRN
ncbi:MAG: acyltransferase [Lachnospiraceae bacterium]|nr:acyltransferase [Lachnospiraceae bacterium]